MTTDRVEAPGLPADWLNAWLAAIGVVVLLPDAKLSWTRTPTPHAVLWVPPGTDLSESIAERLVTADEIAASAIAPELPGTRAFRRHVDEATYDERAHHERAMSGYLLSASVTDLADRDGDGLTPHGPFDPSVPKGITLAERITALCHQRPDADAVAASLAGWGRRIAGNGLGFCPKRLSAGVQASGPASKVHVDPVVELLVVAALQLFPTRGDGQRVRPRGWRDRPTKRGAFIWPTWHVALDQWGIDALLDNPQLADGPRWQSVPYTPSTPSDVTRAYFSESGP